MWWWNVFAEEKDAAGEACWSVAAFFCSNYFSLNFGAIGEDSEGTVAAAGIVGEEGPKTKEKAARCWHWLRLPGVGTCLISHVYALKICGFIRPFRFYYYQTGKPAMLLVCELNPCKM
jgi:hypothetical protein